MKVFSVFDLKAGAFLPPFFFQSIGLAIRAFTDVVNDAKSSVARYPGDFTLYQIGEFDEVKGVLTPLAQHINLGLASSFVEVPKVIMPPTSNGVEKEVVR